MQDKKTSAPVKKRSLSGRSILDPVDRAKRFLVIIQYVIRQIFVENHPTFLRNLQNITIALDIYDRYERVFTRRPKISRCTNQ